MENETRKATRRTNGLKSRICMYGVMWKHNVNEKVISHGICLQQILVPSRVTDLDLHNKIFEWDLTYLQTDS